MKNKPIAIFGYNFPHWKTNAGLINLCANGFRPDMVILQNKKDLNIPRSKYSFGPRETLFDPKYVCESLGLRYIVCDHDDTESCIHLGIILGARILKKHTVENWPNGIINVHPGILPGNRGLDNLKWSIINNLPIGVTSHFIDHRIDMGRILMTDEVDVTHGDTLETIYLKQRQLEQQVLIETLGNLDKINAVNCEFSEKYSAVPDELDNNWVERVNNWVNENKIL